jgi:quercetin dioxygenase-like cupin family protein
MRRIVTGITNEGKSVVVSDGPSPRSHDFVHIPGHSSTIIWTTDGNEVAPTPGEDRTLELKSILPAPGATILTRIQFPPESVFTSLDFDPSAAEAEQREHSPGLLELFEEHAFSPYHTTPTIDYLIILEGELVLLLDDNCEIVSHAGDIIVQNGVRHGWANRSDRTASMIGVMVGVKSAS